MGGGVPLGMLMPWVGPGSPGTVPAVPDNLSPDGPSSSLAAAAAWCNAWGAAWGAANGVAGAAEPEQDPLQVEAQPPQQLTISSVVGSFPGDVRVKRELLSPPPTQHPDIVMNPVHNAYNTRSKMIKVKTEKELFPEAENADGQRNEADSKANSCKDCGCIFSSARVLHDHRKYLYRCKSCLWTGCSWKALARHDLEEHAAERAIECPVCDSRFATERAMHIHAARMHSKSTASLTCTCEACGAGFGTAHHRDRCTGGRVSRASRAARAATPEDHKPSAAALAEAAAAVSRKPYVCKLCLASFCKKSTVREHIRNAHTLKHPIKCPVCVASFRTDRSLKMHLKVHSLPRLFKCTLCLASFEVREELLKHLQVHLNPDAGVSAVGGAAAVAIKKELGESLAEPFVGFRGFSSLIDVKTDLSDN